MCFDEWFIYIKQIVQQYVKSSKEENLNYLQ